MSSIPEQGSNENICDNISNLKISRHFGRLGNNMNYIINAIQYCIDHNILKLDIGKTQIGNQHRVNTLFEDEIININVNSDIPLGKSLSHWGHFFYKSENPFYRRKEIVQHYIIPRIKFQPKIINKDDLVIHLRGGDIFTRGHYAYVQPPLSFYVNIIKSRNWSEIYVISEDKKNPCFDILVNKYNCKSFMSDENEKCSQDFQKDLQVMIGCYNFVASKSSLSPLIVQLSSTIKNVYLANEYLTTNLRENQIWWSDDLKNRSESFEYYGLTFHIQNYSKYFDQFHNNFDLSKPENKKLLIDMELS